MVDDDKDGVIFQPYANLRLFDVSVQDITDKEIFLNIVPNMPVNILLYNLAFLSHCSVLTGALVVRVNYSCLSGATAPPPPPVFKWVGLFSLHQEWEICTSTEAVSSQ